MSPEAIYTTVVFSLSIGFVAASIVFGFFMEDKGRYYLPLFAAIGVFIALIVETLSFGIPRFGFSPLQVFTVPIGSVVAFGLFFYIVHIYTKSHSL